MTSVFYTPATKHKNRAKPKIMKNKVKQEKQLL